MACIYAVLVTCPNLIWKVGEYEEELTPVVIKVGSAEVLSVRLKQLKKTWGFCKTVKLCTIPAGENGARVLEKKIHKRLALHNIAVGINKNGSLAMGKEFYLADLDTLEALRVEVDTLKGKSYMKRDESDDLVDPYDYFDGDYSFLEKDNAISKDEVYLMRQNNMANEKGLSKTTLSVVKQYLKWF
jgi:hypothetical protein